MAIDPAGRRCFITLLGGAAAGWPLRLARTQQQMRRIGFLLSGLAADDPEGHGREMPLVQWLQELGWIDGRNMRIDARHGLGDVERLRRFAAELVALTPDVKAIYPVALTVPEPPIPCSSTSADANSYRLRGRVRSLNQAASRSALPTSKPASTRAARMRSISARAS